MEEGFFKERDQSDVELAELMKEGEHIWSSDRSSDIQN